MKTLLASLFMVTLFAGLSAQEVTTIEATDGDISDNLDLEAVASLFADCETLEEFEQRLNDPDERYSNLDLNEDGYVDYLRILEYTEDDAHLVIIQAVVAKDLYQDVATIEVEKDESEGERVQIVGDSYIYGPDYIIEPVFVFRPRIFVRWWRPGYIVWVSPWYWDYYPQYWHWWNPYPVYVYSNYIHVHIHHHHYHYVNHRRNARCRAMHRSYRRNAIESQKPGTGFTSRNNGVSNRAELVKLRDEGKAPSPKPVREVDGDWKPQNEKEGRESKVKDNKVSVPKNQPDKSDRTKDRSDSPADKPGTRNDRDRKTKDRKSKDRTTKDRKTKERKVRDKQPKSPNPPKTNKPPSSRKPKRDKGKNPAPQTRPADKQPSSRSGGSGGNKRK